MSKTVNIQDVIDLLLMNREAEYKKSLSAEAKHKSVIRSKHDAHVAFCDYLIECVKQLSSEQPQWIPCSKKLPSDSDYYLVTDAYGDVSVIWFAHEKDYYGKSEWRETENEILAWMPLPEPWRGDSDD